MKSELDGHEITLRRSCEVPDCLHKASTDPEAVMTSVPPGSTLRWPAPKRTARSQESLSVPTRVANLNAWLAPPWQPKSCRFACDVDAFTTSRQRFRLPT